MFRNSDEWMFGCQVMNQSVENGSMPRAGDSPWTSLYRRNRRSYDRSVSDSRTCRRAPSLINAIARWICLLSETMLLIRMMVPCRRFRNYAVTLANCPAITMLACRPATAAPVALDFGFEWLVKRFQTISSSNRNRRINWFDPAIFINCAGLN